MGEMGKEAPWKRHLEKKISQRVAPERAEATENPNIRAKRVTEKDNKKSRAARKKKTKKSPP